jgi:erythromycin esterase-like protein
LNQTLNQQTQLDSAHANLAGLIEIERSLAGQSRQIAESVESLQLLTGLQGEFNDQMTKLEAIQRGFTELLLMESSVARAVKMVQPLAELGNLRRNNEQEIRAAAREIINRRETRMAEEKSKYDDTTGEYSPPVRPVPAPPADLD